MRVIFGFLITTALLLAFAIPAADMDSSVSNHGPKNPLEQQAEKCCKTVCQMFQNPKVCSKRGITYDCVDLCEKMTPLNSPYKFAYFGTCH